MCWRALANPSTTIYLSHPTRFTPRHFAALCEVVFGLSQGMCVDVRIPPVSPNSAHTAHIAAPPACTIVMIDMFAGVCKRAVDITRQPPSISPEPNAAPPRERPYGIPRAVLTCTCPPPFSHDPNPTHTAPHHVFRLSCGWYDWCFPGM